MTFTPPATWTAGQLITANNLNEQLRDDLIALKDPPSAVFNSNEGANYTTSSTAFGNVDATNGKYSLSLTLDVASSLLVIFCGSGENSGANRLYLDIALDGVRVGGDDGLLVIGESAATAPQGYHLTHLLTNVAAGSHTINLQWKVSAGTQTLYAGDGTATKDTHSQFFVIQFN